jgi:hypothetical protein
MNDRPYLFVVYTSSQSRLLTFWNDVQFFLSLRRSCSHYIFIENIVMLPEPVGACRNVFTILSVILNFFHKKEKNIVKYLCMCVSSSISTFKPMH